MRTYGYAPEGGDPRRFEPDEQVNTPQEMAAWREALAAAEAGTSWSNPRVGLESIRNSEVLYVSGSLWGMGTYTYPVSTEDILAEVVDERAHQDAKWGEQNHDDFIWSAILGEEVGEACQAALHDRFGGSHAGTLREELMHVAAVAVQWIECIDRREEADDDDQ